MSKLKVDGYSNLVRDIRSNAIINDSKSEYELYMRRIKIKENQNDEVRNACKEINNLKKELYEIKKLLKKVVNKDGS
jgi:hypothetical protein